MHSPLDWWFHDCVIPHFLPFPVYSFLQSYKSSLRFLSYFHQSSILPTVFVYRNPLSIDNCSSRMSSCLAPVPMMRVAFATLLVSAPFCRLLVVHAMQISPRSDVSVFYKYTIISVVSSSSSHTRRHTTNHCSRLRPNAYRTSVVFLNIDFRKNLPGPIRKMYLPEYFTWTPSLFSLETFPPSSFH